LLGPRVVFYLGDAFLQFAEVNSLAQALSCSETPFGALRQCFPKQNAAAAARAFGFVGEELDKTAAGWTGYQDAIQVLQALLARTFVRHG
jgi:hypothetical protein